MTSAGSRDGDSQGRDDGQGRAATESPPAASSGSHPSRSRSEIPLWNNVITIVGVFLAIIALLGLVTFALFHLVAPIANPYVDIVGYLVIPGILVLGLILMPLGILFKSWRLRRHDPEQRLTFRLPRVDLNDPVQRKAVKVVVIGTFVLLPAVGVSSYHGYHYTDSIGFCSEACHSVMEPEATTFEDFSHARVPCSECHIGPGASWFVKSKLSGTRQVLAMLRETYSRPIPPAIRHLRPARETCEHCHWPEKFFGAQLREIVYFTADEDNTRHEIDMLLKTGGADASMGRVEGIHLHIALGDHVEYIATDEERQVIPWVKFTKAGTELIYRSDGRPSSDPPPEGQLRSMDCMDCHNRPAHKFRSPADAVDAFLETETIDPTLPYIKREAVAALAEPYADTDTAMERISSELTTFYENDYPEVWQTRRVAVNEAIEGVQRIYRQTIFPYMKVDWRTYPDNIGHKTSPGCFRCHEGKHINQNGDPISHNCDGCHTFLNPVDRAEGRSVVERGDFIHPVPLRGEHGNLRCDLCHTGGLPPSSTCEGCHTMQAAFRNGMLPSFEDLELEAEPMADSVDCESCHDLDEPTTVEAIDAMCMDCHDDEEYEGMLASWKLEVDELFSEAEDSADAEEKALLDAVRQAGPLHNPEATRIIIRTVLEDRTVD
jgi:hypothetical protein